MIKYDDYVKKLERLQRNREKTTPEQRETTYKKQFEDYEKQLRKDSEQVLCEFVTGGLKFSPEIDTDPRETALLDDFGKKVRSIFQEEWPEIDSTIGRTIRAADEKCMDGLIAKLWPRIWYEAYPVYWLPHCRTENGKFKNDLLDPGWSWKPEWHVWANEECSAWALMIPPTQEEIEKEKEGWQ